MIEEIATQTSWTELEFLVSPRHWGLGHAQPCDYIRSWVSAVRIFMVGICTSRDQQFLAPTSTDDHEDTGEGDESDGNASDLHSSETEGPDSAAANPKAGWGSGRVRSDKSLAMISTSWNKMSSSQSKDAGGLLLREVAPSTQ
ncbi:hypothetical protein HYPSUDRAFT_199274 [Hypholoma sublateritium FD-334 SS-4]|uniref:Uncharacterized protein n=1 Tax=Hypholoma sublateritium (strain FD-334 SS-4) TaxID=945553 RepID=A0A0D2MPZ5_HYPSF|nr:hypothetical protein HYPSUDRAFT_199274 [Hypholoma sublateritium FD-334 SS-4]